MYTLKNINQLTINKGQKISDAIKKINASKIKIVFVIDKNKKLLGSISSGDIRRSIRNKVDQNSYVETIMFTKTTFVYEKYEEKLNKKSFNEYILCIPVVKKNKILKYFKIINKPFNKKSNTIFLMAGGKGKRLYPLTKDTPKPMLRIKNVPIIEKIITEFKNQGFINFIISINYLASKIKSYLGTGKKLGVNIKYINEKKFLGTAGSLSLSDYKNLNSPIIVANSDLISEVDYSNLLDYHNKRKADLTICAINKIFEMPYGEIVLKHVKVKKIIEKPITNNLVNAGIYVIDKNILRGLKKNKRLMMNDFITHLIKRNKSILSYPIHENWIDIGNKLDLYKARK